MQDSPELKAARKNEYDDRKDYAIAQKLREDGAKQLEEMKNNPNYPRGAYEDSLRTHQEVHVKNEIAARNKWEKSKIKLIEVEKLEEKKRVLREELDNEFGKSL